MPNMHVQEASIYSMVRRPCGRSVRVGCSPFLDTMRNPNKLHIRARTCYSGGMNITAQLKVSVDLSPDEWQLFVDDPDAPAAARALNDAASAALSESNRDGAYAIFRDASNKWAAVGASDSEPWYMFDLMYRRVWDFFSEDTFTNGGVSITRV
jgi:hypothetical protein